MPAELSALAGFACGIGVGALYAWVARGGCVPYGRWLGRRCWVRPHGRAVFAEHVVVAVSWRGAVCVRRADRMDEDGHWIKKQNVRWRVRWEEPR